MASLHDSHHYATRYLAKGCKSIPTLFLDFMFFFAVATVQEPRPFWAQQLLGSTETGTVKLIPNDGVQL